MEHKPVEADKGRYRPREGGGAEGSGEYGELQAFPGPSLAILDELLLPIIGVDSNKIMVLINREARSLIRSGRQMIEGRRVSDFLSADIEEKIDECMRAGARETIKGLQVLGKKYDIEIVPLSRRYFGNSAQLKMTSLVLRQHENKPDAQCSRE